MTSYVSSELIDKLRAQQHGLRDRLRALEAGVMASDDAGLVDAYRTLSRAYDTHEDLVAALLEAVEPDRPGRTGV